MKTLLLTAALAAASTVAMAEPEASRLVGTWTCSFDQSTEQMSMAVTYEVDYAASHDTDVAMVLAMEVPSMNESIKVGMNMKGTWELVGDELINTTETWDIRNLGEESAFSQMAIEQFKTQQKQGTVSRTKIVELTENRLVEQPQGSGQEPVVCTR